MNQSNKGELRQIKACGVLIVRGNPVEQFLLMKHKDRWDLPKGHTEKGETEIETALREMSEETGLDASDIALDANFRFSTSYDVWPKRFGGERCRKTTVIFLGRLRHFDVDVEITEHVGFEWLPWKPPHSIQPETIDPLLAALHVHLKASVLR